MAHEDLKAHLYSDPGKVFVASMTNAVYKWSAKVPSQYYEYRIFEELTIRYSTGTQTRLGLDKSDNYRFDAVFFIKPGYRAVNQHQCYTVGVELKNSKEDLKYDEKIHQYLGWTDFFMIGVPSELIDEAKKKIASLKNEHPETEQKIGLFAVDTGKIEICPKRQIVSQQTKIDIQEQIIYNCIFKDIKAVNFVLEDIEILPIELNCEYKEACTSFIDAASVSVEKPQPLYDSSKDSVSIVNEDNRNPGTNAREDNVACEDKQLQEENKQKEKEIYKANAEKEAKRLAELAKRGESLPTSTLALYNQLKPNGKEIFWSIVDNNGSSKRKDIAKETKMSLPTIDRYLPELTDAGLIEYEGSRKTGRFVVKVSTDKSASCDTCAIKDTCQFKGASEGMCAKHR